MHLVSLTKPDPADGKIACIRVPAAAAAAYGVSVRKAAGQFVYYIRSYGL